MDREDSICVRCATLVIFGGTGDLTHRKLIPALYNLAYDNLMPRHFAVVAVGRRDKTHQQYRDEAFASLNTYSRNKLESKIWARLRAVIYYVQMDFTRTESFSVLKSFLEEQDKDSPTARNRVFYLAVAPDYFETIVRGLHASGLAGSENPEIWRRLVIEKPFGKDLTTARELNMTLLNVFPERDIYRIDHYLGKDMIQNILVLRFCNSVFEYLWSSKYIDNIQVSLLEKDGVGSRGGYYDNAGAIRDMVQNHIIQILAMVAMEPPVNLEADAIRSEKLKVIQAIEEYTPEMLRDNVVLGQYSRGIVSGQPVQAYREEEKVAPESGTETFAALKLHINNFRWAGIPFYVRTGKRMADKAAEIVIQFKALPNILFFKDQHVQEPNLLVIRVQPSVGVFFQFNTKDFTPRQDIVPVKMDFGYPSTSQGNTPEAYERLIFDVLRGDTTLFSRWDEVEASWQIADRIISFRKQKRISFPNYEAGTMGPVQAFALLARDGREWWNI